MLTSVKWTLLFGSFFLLTALSLSAQEMTPPEPDEEFNLFLFSLASLAFFCAIGAAAIGGALAAFTAFLLFALLALGALSTSAAIGLYNRSFSAGLRSFLFIAFGAGCMITGAVGLWLLDAFTSSPLSPGLAAGLGAAGGLLCGLLMAQASYFVLRAASAYFLRKLNQF